jgi:YggT family protein
MMEDNPFVGEFWLYHWMNFLLSVIAYTLLGRALLGLFVHPSSGNYVMRFFCWITDPVLKLGSYMTPPFFVEGLKPVWVAGLVLLLRFVLFLVFNNLGMVALPSGV